MSGLSLRRLEVSGFSVPSEHKAILDHLFVIPKLLKALNQTKEAFEADAIQESTALTVRLL